MTRNRLDWTVTIHIYHRRFHAEVVRTFFGSLCPESLV